MNKKTPIGRMLMLVVLAGFAAPLRAQDQGKLAHEARVEISGQDLAVGAANPAAESFLDCATNTVQHTIRSCKATAPAGAYAMSLGRRVEGATLNVHFQGKIINMSVEFADGSSADAIIAQLKSDLGQDPKIQYWADPTHLYGSYIWVDGKTEIEVTKVVKGDAGDGRVRMYVSTLLGGLPMSPDDQQ